MFLLPGGLSLFGDNSKKEPFCQSLGLMIKKENLLDLRIQLDDAITYGSHEEATELAHKGLRRALEAGLSAEVEYFKGQIELLIILPLP